MRVRVLVELEWSLSDVWVTVERITVRPEITPHPQGQQSAYDVEELRWSNLKKWQQWQQARWMRFQTSSGLEALESYLRVWNY